MILKAFMTFWVYIFPLPAWIAFFYYWWNKYNSLEYATFLVILPTLYGYIVPGIGTNLMKKWKFHGPLTIGNLYLHHGFKYAANMNLWFFLASYNVDLSQLSFSGGLLLALTTGTFHAFFITIHDTLAIRQGKIELKNVLKRPGMSALDEAVSYAPATFIVLGSTYGLSCYIAYQYIKLNTFVSELGLLSLITVSLSAMILTSSLVFGFLEFRVKYHGHKKDQREDYFSNLECPQDLA